jgi:hypothetical protein
MRAAWYERQGPANEVLIVGEMPDPRPGAGEVRIRIAASGVERVQWIKYSEIMYTIRRFYPWPQPTQHSRKPGMYSPNTEAFFGPRRRWGLAFTRVPSIHTRSSIKPNSRPSSADVSPDVASFMADSQVPWGVEALGGAITQPAWRTKPSWYLITTEDKMIPPDAQHAMSKRPGSTVVEVKAAMPCTCRILRQSPISSKRPQQVPLAATKGKPQKIDCPYSKRRAKRLEQAEASSVCPALASPQFA